MGQCGRWKTRNKAFEIYNGKPFYATADPNVKLSDLFKHMADSVSESKRIVHVASYFHTTQLCKLPRIFNGHVVEVHTFTVMNVKEDTILFQRQSFNFKSADSDSWNWISSNGAPYTGLFKV